MDGCVRDCGDMDANFILKLVKPSQVGRFFNTLCLIPLLSLYLTLRLNMHIILKAFSENVFRIFTLMHFKSRPPTIADVAEHAGVSIATVSRVLNGTVPVQPAKAERVRLAMDELQFVPRTAARVLASKHTHTIGLILPEISGAFFSPMLRGIESEAHEIDYDLLIHSMHATLSNPNHSSPLGEHNTDGLLVFTNSLDERQLARFIA